MLINISNQPSTEWSKEQLEDANSKWGEVKDYKFPTVDPSMSEEGISTLANVIIADTIEFIKSHEYTVFHIMGEFSLTYALITRLTAMGYVCVCSASDQIIENLSDGRKVSSFKFIRFRSYNRNYNVGRNN